MRAHDPRYPGGRRPLGVRERSGASLVGLQRDGKAMVKVPRDFCIAADDLIIPFGTVASITEFAREFRAARR